MITDKYISSAEALHDVHTKQRFGIIVSLHAKHASVLPIYTNSGTGLRYVDPAEHNEYANIRNFPGEKQAKDEYQKENKNIPDEWTMTVNGFHLKKGAVLCLSDTLKQHYDTRMDVRGKLTGDSLVRLTTMLLKYNLYATRPEDADPSLCSPCDWFMAKERQAQLHKEKEEYEKMVRSRARQGVARAREQKDPRVQGKKESSKQEPDTQEKEHTGKQQVPDEEQGQDKEQKPDKEQESDKEQKPNCEVAGLRTNKRKRPEVEPSEVDGLLQGSTEHSRHVRQKKE